MTNYDQLLKQREELDKQIEAARAQALSSAIQQVQDLVAQHGLTVDDVFPSRKRRASGRGVSTGKVAPKYRDPATGATWTGRGKAPKWIDGKDRKQFEIQ